MLAEYQPRGNPFPFLMRILLSVAYVVALSVTGTVETIGVAASKVDSIDETIFPQGVGKIPERFLVTGSYII